MEKHFHRNALTLLAADEDEDKDGSIATKWRGGGGRRWGCSGSGDPGWDRLVEVNSILRDEEVALWVIGFQSSSGFHVK